MSILFTAESPSTQGSAWVTELNRYLLHWKFEFPDSPGGPVVPNPPASAGHSCLSPGLGDSTRGATSAVWHHCWAPVPRHGVQRVFAWMNALLNTGQKKATKAMGRNSKKRRLINHLHLPNSYPELRPGASLGTEGGHRSENASFPKWDVKPSPTKRVPRMITEMRKAVIQ